jgi:hypothetical protein
VGNSRHSLRVLAAGYANGVAYALDGKTIATAGSEGVRLWDAETGAALRRFPGRAYHAFFSSDGTRIWDLAAGELTTAKEVVFSPDWKLVPRAPA